ncbi:MAG: carboxypeptidase regulatory-like domain-containing protein [Endomicrobia bacterium]|nr:carboxypeptidase regulatory-like domain-containing protein [Endomicrobiia bacterium]
MNKNKKVIYLSMLFFIFIGATNLIAETISGKVFYSGNTTSGKFWVWASTNPMGTSGSEPITLSSFTVSGPVGSTVTINYTLLIPSNLLPRKIYVYAMRDTNSPYVEDYLSGQIQGVDPTFGDPKGELPGGIQLNLGQNPTNINFSIYDPPQGKISGQVFYEGSSVPQNVKIKIAVGRGRPAWQEGPVSYTEIIPDLFPVSYQLLYLPDATDYYVIAVLDDNNPSTQDPYTEYGPVMVYPGNNRHAQNVNLTLSGLPQGKISGTIYYEGNVPTGSILVIVAGYDQPKQNWNAVSGYEVGTFSLPYNFTLQTIPDGENFYVMAAIKDANQNLIASGIAGPITVLPTNDRWATGVNIVLSSQGGGGSGGGMGSIYGNIIYPLSSLAYVRMKIGYGTQAGIYNVIKEYQRYGSGFYKFENLPDADNYYISAFADLNNNFLLDPQEPSAYVGPIQISGGLSLNQDISLVQREIKLSTITVTIRGRVYDDSMQPIGGAVITLLDILNDSDPRNDVPILSTESSGSYQQSQDGLSYNFELPNVVVKASLIDYSYYYIVSGLKTGYKRNEVSQSFYEYHNNEVIYYDLFLESKPEVEVKNVSIAPTTISPNNDNVNDYLNISLKYIVKTLQKSYDNGGTVKFIVDTNKDNEFEPIDWGMFVYDNQNRIFMKKDPNYYFDPLKPLDYSKLIGPLSQEEYDKIVASYDSVVDYWINGNELTQDEQNNESYSNISFRWEGRNNAHQILKNGTYKYILFVEDYYENIIYQTTGTVSISAPSIIGVIKDEQGNPIQGARVSCGGPNFFGGKDYSAENGSFEISGLKTGEQYYLEVQADGYVSFSINNVVAKINPTDTDKVQVTLKKGVEISGYVILPNPPKAGEVFDNSGYPLNNLWLRIEAQNLSGGEWSWKDTIIMLPNSQVSITSAPYTLYLKPNSKVKLVAKTQGYISKEVIVEVGTSKLNVNIELTKAAKLIGFIKLPQEETTINELLSVAAEGIGMSVFANTKDNKLNSGCFVWFSKDEIFAGNQKQFVIDSLLPNTTYNLGLDSQYIARVQMSNIYISGFEKQLNQPILISLGVRLKGSIQFGPGVYEKIKDKMQNINTASGNTLGVWVSIGLESQKDFITRWHGIAISSPQIANSEVVQFSLPGLQLKEKYKIKVDGWFREGLQIEDDFIIDIPTTTSTNVIELSQPIKILIPTGIVKGKLVNNTGKQIDKNKIRIIMVIFDGGGFYFTDPDDNLNFTFNNVPTGEGLMWGCEYNVKPGEAPGDFFGVPTGNAGMFGISIYAIHNSTVDIGTISLKPAGKIEVLLKGPQYLLEEIYNGTTTYLKQIETGQIITEGPYGLMRIQPTWLKRIAEIMREQDLRRGEDEDKIMDIKEISIGIDNTIEKVDDTTLKYKFYGAEEGSLNIYAMVGKLPVFRWREQGSYEQHKAIIESFTISPVEQAVISKPNETKIAEFVVSEGVEINGTIMRPSIASGTEEIITVTLRDKFSGRVVVETQVVFNGTNKNQLSGQFKFIKVPPGEYILLILSPNYRAYSKTLTVPADLASLTLATISLNKGANIVGRLIDEYGNPVTYGVLVECIAVPFVDGSYKNTDMPGLGISTELLALGQFKLTNLPQGTYIVKVTNKADGGANYINTTKAGIILPNAALDVEIGDIILKKAVEITGKVYDTDGKTPLYGVEVLAYPQDIQLRQGMECRATTDKDGSFRVKGINPGIRLWEIKVNPRDRQNIFQIKSDLRKYTEFVKSNINVTKEEYRTNLNITLRVANAEIKGLVTTKDGGSLLLPFEIYGIDIKDYPAAVVLVQNERDVTSGDPMAGMKVLTNSDGTFEVKGISSGKYLLKVFSRGYATKTLNIDVTEGVNNIQNIELEKGLKVSGAITTQTGEKVSKNNVKAVVASNKNFSKMVIGFVDANPITQEVEGYEVNGLESGVTYYLIIVPEGANYVIVDPKPLYVTTSDVTWNLVYKKPKPHFEVKSYKFRNINKGYLSKWLDFFELSDLTILMSMPQETWATHLFIAQLIQDKQLDIDTLSSNDIFDLYLIFGFITEPVIEENVEDIVTKVEADNNLIPFYLSDTKKQLVVGYVPTNVDTNRGYFEFKFSAVNYYGESGEENYRFYVGEDARVEKVISPITGGTATIGEEDGSGLEVLPGTEFKDVDVSSQAKIIVTKFEEETVVQSALGKFAPKSLPKKLASSMLNYPGELASAIYDMKVQLISGPLAVLANNNKVKLNIKLTNTITQNDANSLKLAHFNESTNKWELENVPLDINWDNLLVSAEVSHMSKFALFKVTVSSVQPYSGEFKTYSYPNPVKNTDKFNIRYCLPGTGKVKVNIKLYNVAGELVRSIEEKEVNAGYIYDVSDIELTNDKGEKLASGVYFYHIKAGDYKKWYKLVVIK